MLQPDLVTRLRLLTETAGLPSAAADDRVHAVEALRPGERVAARIGQPLPNGNFLVTVRGKAYEMQLPSTARTGDALALTFLTDEPQPTFFLLRTQDRSNELSPAGRLIATLAREPAAAQADASRVHAPLLPDVQPDPAGIVPKLREALSLSGLFYESHQAEWLNGTRSLAQLHREPQARIETHLITKDRMDNGQNARAVSPGTPDPPVPAELRGGPVHPDAYPLLRQQLDALENRNAPWHGQIWPGQWMEWETGETHEEQSGKNPPAWYTRLYLDLPQLGPVQIRAILAAHGVRITVECADAKCADRLQRHADVLAAGLAVRDLRLEHLSVDVHDSNR